MWAKKTIKDIIITQEMAEALYQRVASLRKHHQLFGLKNDFGPVKLIQALKILQIETIKINFYEKDKYKIEVNDENLKKLQKILNPLTETPSYKKK